MIEYLTCRSEMLSMICTVQIHPSKHVLDDAGYTAHTRQHEPDHTKHTYHTDQESICLSALKHLVHAVGIDDLSEV